MRNVMCVLMALVAVCAMSSVCVAAELKALPGYVDIEKTDLVGKKAPEVKVTLEGALLKMLAAASAEADPGLGKLLPGIDAIQVQVYSDLEGGNVPAKARTLGAALKKQGWSDVVSIPEEDEYIEFLVKSDDDFILGLLGMVAEEDSLVFINVVGTVDAAEFGKQIGKVIHDVGNGEMNFAGLIPKDALKALSALNGVEMHSGADHEDGDDHDGAHNTEEVEVHVENHDEDAHAEHN
jgi:hypothetical protein